MKKLLVVMIMAMILLVGCSHNTRVSYSRVYAVNQNETVWSRVNSYVHNNRIPVVSENQYVLTTPEYVISREVTSSEIKLIVTGFIECSTYGLFGELSYDSVKRLDAKKSMMKDLLNYAETGVSKSMITNDMPPGTLRLMK